MGDDVVNAGDRWIPEEQYREILARIPIVCVDVILSPGGDRSQIGLIRRHTYDGGVGWCLVGGAVLRDEPLRDAVVRHVRATLGDGLVVERESIAMRTIAEYFTTPRAGELHDPRKHAVALTYTADCSGVAAPLGEALAFEWISVDDLDRVEWGFGQGQVVHRVMSSLKRHDRAAAASRRSESSDIFDAQA